MRARAALAGAALVVALGSYGAVADVARPAPGDAITIEGGPGGCTLGFLFTGSDGAAYMSTAGHCLLGQTEGVRSWRPGTGPVASASGRSIGRLVFAENLPSADGGDFYDFALIRLGVGVSATPAIRSYGPPAGINDELSDSPAVLRMHGQATGVSAVAPAREVLAPSLSRPEHVYAHGLLLFGDSGAPVIDEQGRAVGTVLGAGSMQVGVGIGAPSVSHDGALNRIGRLSPVLRHAANATGIRFRLHPAVG